MIRLLLTSSFKDVISHFIEFANDNLEGKRITFIPTASKPETIVHYVFLAKRKLESLGMIVENLDISTAPIEKINETLERNEFIYVSGGNTFFLLQELRKSGADQLLIQHINSGKLYIGESAGAVIASPHIEYIHFLDDKGKAKQLQDFKGMDLIDHYPVPHFNNIPFKRAVSDLIAHYETKLPLLPISNTQVIQVMGNKITVK